MQIFKYYVELVFFFFLLTFNRYLQPRDFDPEPFLRLRSPLRDGCGPRFPSRGNYRNDAMGIFKTHLNLSQSLLWIDFSVIGFLYVERLAY
jgi:hypothetical protein